MKQRDFRAVDPQRSRIVLIGVPHYRDESLLDLPVIAHNVTDLWAIFTDPELGRFPAEHCASVPPEADTTQIGEILTTAAAEATDLLLMYYSGHGLIDRRGKLYLSLAGTRLGQPAYSALAFDAIAETFRDAPADNRMVILDSCFSGRIIDQPLAADEEAVLNELEVSGTFTLTSAPANRVALVRTGEHHTAFTGRLIQLFREGTPKAGQMLTPEDIYRHLSRQLAAEGLPPPQRRGTNAAEFLGLIRNRHLGSAREFLVAGPLPVLASAAATGEPADPGPPWQPLHGGTVSNEDYAAMAIDQALRLTSRASNKQGRRLRLAQIAPVVAAVDEHQALGLVVSMSEPERRDSILADIAVVVAVTDIFRGIEIVRGNQYRLDALLQMAKLADRRHSGEGEYILDTYILEERPPPLRDLGNYHDSKLRTTAEVVAEFAPDRAQIIAESIADWSIRLQASAGIARAMAGTDPDRALRIINQLIDSEYPRWIKEGHYGPGMLSIIAEAVAAVDPDRALGIVASIVGEKPYPYTLADIAETIARTDPDRAVDITQDITDFRHRAEVLTAAAGTVASTTFDQALAIISKIGAVEVEEAALADLVPILASSDPARAMYLADGITDELWQVYALSGIASVLLDTPQHRSRAVTLAAR